MDAAENEPAWRPEAEAHKRAMPLQRLTGNGMDYADVVELYRQVDLGIYWSDAAEGLGDRNLERARSALEAGYPATAASWFRYAASCFRVGQVPLPDADGRKSRMFRKLIDAFGAAGELDSPPTEHVAIPWSGAALCGWLIRPDEHRHPSPPTVIIMGGFDGWREEYAVGAQYLVARGMAVLLMDGPGQGETRLFQRLTMSEDVASAFSSIVDWALADDRLGAAVAIWGNSMGGFLAALTATVDRRLAACVVNGGTIRPAEILERFPRFISKVQPLLGIDDADEAAAALGRFELGPDDLARLSSPLLVLHGTPDQVFLIENARALYDGATSTDKTFEEWPDGDHCIYNHSHEKHTIVADWLADRLVAQ